MVCTVLCTAGRHINASQGDPSKPLIDQSDWPSRDRMYSVGTALGRSCSIDCEFFCQLYEILYIDQIFPVNGDSSESLW